MVDQAKRQGETGVADPITRLRGVRWGYVSLGLFLGGVLCGPLMLLVGGGFWREGGHGPGPAVTVIAILAACLFGSCLLASAAGAILSRIRLQRILSVVFLAITGYMTIRFAAGLVDILSKRAEPRIGPSLQEQVHGK